MQIEVGKNYQNRQGDNVLIVDSFIAHDRRFYYDDHGRSYYPDGVPTSEGVGSGFRLVGEV